MAVSDKTLFYVYAYNSGSLREFTVDTCRKRIMYSKENEFLKDSYLFIRNARMRARDDLTAPVVKWFSDAYLNRILPKQGLYPIRQDIDFSEYLNGYRNREFYPYQILCKLEPAKSIKVKKNVSPFQEEINDLKRIAEAVFLLENVSMEEKKKITIGFYNTHFAYLEMDGGIKKAVIELFLYLMNILIQKEANPSNMHFRVGKYLSLCRDSLGGVKRRKYMEVLPKNLIVDFLIRNNIRL
jgi:hypothetical protein